MFAGDGESRREAVTEVGRVFAGTLAIDGGAGS